MSQREAARRLGVTPMALGNVINGTSGISPEMAVRLEKFMGNGPQGAEFWLRLQGDYDLWRARVKLKDELARIEPAPHEPKAA
jgi:antitoxin HigA-1